MGILEFLTAAGAVLPNVNFQTADWALFKKDAAGVVTAEDEIEQSMVLICSTIPGSDPMRPEFGCDFLPALDSPLSRGLPLLVTRITNALATWEPRIKILNVSAVPDIQGILKITVIWVRVSSTDGRPNTLSFALK